MSVAFTPWPEELAARYIEKGYWKGLPLTDVITRYGKELASASRTALICQQRQFSYAELDRLSDILASRLHRQGFRAGETAVMQLPNIAEFYIVYFALLKVGIVPVNALFNHKQLELRSYVEQVQPALMVVSERHQLFQDAQFANALAEQSSTIRHWLVDGETTFGTSLSEWLEALPSEQAEISSSIPTPTPASEVAFFQLSGGSTGTPKLIPRTHNDYYYSVRASAELCLLNKDTVYLCALPAPHNFSLSSPGALGVFYAGGTVVLATDPSAMTCFPLIKQHGVTMTALVPPAVTLWLQAAEDFDHLDSLKVLQVGGARLSESLAKQIMPILGCQLQQVFGMAEGLVNYTRFDDDNWHLFNTQGRPISEDDEIKVVDEQGIQVPDGEEGALLTRGPYTFHGYFNCPDHNASAFDTDGFYRSGDIVKRTATGYLIVVGRDKDQINRGGEKIAAEEVENQLLTHEAVTNVALVAMPDTVMGEKSCAFVIAADPKLKAITLRKHLRAQGVAEYKLPDRVEFVSELPMTPVGKVDKKQLRQTIQQTLTIKKEKDV